MKKVIYNQEDLSDHYGVSAIIKNDKNLGFGAANDIGVKSSQGEYLFFLNNDTESPSDMLEKLIKFKKDKNLNIVGPRIVNAKGIDPLDGSFLQLDVLASPGPGSRLFYVEGCSLIIGRDDFAKLGGFDEKYFMYSEDTDLCWRANLFGMRLGICEDTRLVHYGGGSSMETQAKTNQRHTTSSERRFWVESHNLRNMLKNYNAVNLLWTVPLFILQNSAESLVYLLTGNFKMCAIIWESYWWNVVNLFDSFKKRNMVQKNRIVSDRELFSLMYFGSYKFSAFKQIGLPKFK